MTDLEKYKQLLNSLGVFYTEERSEGVPPRTLVTLSEDYGYEGAKITVKDTPNNHKVEGYYGYHCYFVFDESGKFEYVGIFS